MARLLEAGLTVLLVSTFAVPAKSNPTVIQPTNSQAAMTQTTQPTVEAQKVDSTRVREAAQVEPTELTDRTSKKLSETERLVLERRLQKLIPPQE